MAEGQEIEFELKCTGDTLAPGTHKLRIPLRIQELLNHPGSQNYNRDYNNRFPCADQPTDFNNYSIATRRYVGPDNGQIEVDLYPQVLSITSIPGDSGSFNKICYLDSQYSPRNPHPREIRFCPKFTLGAITSARIKVTNRNPVVIVEALDEVITAGGTARFKLKRIWDSDVVNLHSTTITFNATVSEQFKKTVPTGPLTFAIGETELIVEIPTMTGEVSDKDGMVRFEILAGISEVQATNVGGHYEVYDQLPGITPSGKSSRVASVRILNNYAVPTSTDRTVTVVEDRPYSFQASDFAFTGRDSGDRAGEREGGDAAGCGQSGAARPPRQGPRGDAAGGDGDRGRCGGGGGHFQAEVHAGGERARVGLRLVHVQGKRRGIGERVSPTR